MQLYRDKKLSLHHKINIYQEMRVNLSSFLRSSHTNLRFGGGTSAPQFIAHQKCG